MRGLIAAVRARVEACVEHGDASSVAEPAALDEAAELWLVAQLEPDSRLEIIYVLAWLHWCRYQVLPEGLDREDRAAALEFFEMVGKTRPDLVPDGVSRILGSPQPAGQDPGVLYTRGVHLFNDFQQTGQRTGIDQALALFHQAADAVPAGHPRRGAFLSALGAGYMRRFESFGDRPDLDQAIYWGSEAVRAAPADHEDRPDALTNLGMTYLTRYENSGDQADLTEAIRLCTEAAQHAEAGHPRGGMLLSNAGLTYRERFELTGGEADLAKSIGYAEAALRETPADNVEFARSLANLGGAYQIRFTRFGDAADLSRAIEYWQKAERESASQADHVIMLSAVGLAFRMRFEQAGADTDLDRAIDHLTRAVREASETHAAYAGMLLNCAVAYRIRFDRFGDGADLDQAFRYTRRAVQVTPDGHPERAKYLSALAAIHHALFEQTGNTGHLDQAVRLGREGLEATPLTHARRGLELSDLGGAYRTRFEQNKAPEDLALAIRYGREAVQATPAGHPERPLRLSNLTRAYLTQYEQTGAETDLGRALRYGTEAVETTPADHPGRASYLANLASVYRAQSERGTPESLDQAIECWRAAVSSPVAPVYQRVAAAMAWGIACETLTDPRPAAEGFAAAVGLLPLLAWRGLDRSVREKHLADVGGLVTDAAGWAIEAGELERAVELLEQGRSVLWSQSLQLRTDLIRLRTVNEDLAARLDEVRSALDRPDPAGEAIEAQDANIDRNQELFTSRQRELAREWDGLIGQVRKLQGFGTFLSPAPFARLREAASAGPVVIVNISNRRCDALIVTTAGVRLHRLPGLTAQECIRQATTLLDTLYAPTEMPATSQRALIDVLLAIMSSLWDTVCEPVLADLHDHGDLVTGQPEQDGTGPRLWWCPTGPLTVLPLHAAGHHADPEGAYLAQMVVSSYTPTLETLLRSRERAQADSTPGVLAVGMPTTPDVGDLHFGDLPAVPRELARLTEALPSVSVTTLRAPTRNELNGGNFGHEETQPTRDRVMRALPRHAWVHLACHGGQNLLDPGQGAVYLTDGPLTVLQLAANELPAAELAFLSACQTAVGGVRLPDETIHLAAAVQFAGYRHVIATAWSISDDHAPQVAADTYTHLAAAGSLDPSRAAAAIHHAVEALRARLARRAA